MTICSIIIEASLRHMSVIHIIPIAKALGKEDVKKTKDFLVALNGLQITCEVDDSKMLAN